MNSTAAVFSAVELEPREALPNGALNQDYINALFYNDLDVLAL